MGGTGGRRGRRRPAAADHPRRPALLGKVALDSIGGSPDPAQLAEAAHTTASLLVESGRATTDESARARLVALVDDVGLDTVAEMWADRPARSLPGALWRLYALREWVRTTPFEASADFAAGRSAAAVSHVVAGVADPPTPEALQVLLDQVLHGVFAGDLDVALERAGAFCRVVVAGRVVRAHEPTTPTRSPPRRSPARPRRCTTRPTTWRRPPPCGGPTTWSDTWAGRAPGVDGRWRGARAVCHTGARLLRGPVGCRAAVAPGPM